MARIALDAMGGDFAPQAPVAGALLALGELDPEHHSQLVGRTAVIEDELARASTRRAPRRSQPLARRIDDRRGARRHRDDRPAHRGDPRQAAQLHGRRAQAPGRRTSPTRSSPPATPARRWPRPSFCSSCITGLTRPAIATMFPTLEASGRAPRLRRERRLLRRGARAVRLARLRVRRGHPRARRTRRSDCSASAKSRRRETPSVKEAHQLLVSGGTQLHRQRRGARPSRAAAATRGPLDVVVCDGFVGNVAAQVLRGRRADDRRACSRTAGIDAEQLARTLSRHLDYSEYGGAPLLGVKGVSIISHGNSSPRAIKNAIKVARARRRVAHERAHRRAGSAHAAVTERHVKRPDRAYRRHRARRSRARDDEPRLRRDRHRDDARVDRRAHGNLASGTSPATARRRAAWPRPPRAVAMAARGRAARRDRRDRPEHGDPRPPAARDRGRSSGRARRDARGGVRHLGARARAGSTG